MRFISGAVVVLAGSVMFTGSMIGAAIRAAGGRGGPDGDAGIPLGITLGLCGLALIVSGFWENRRPTDPPK